MICKAISCLFLAPIRNYTETSVDLSARGFPNFQLPAVCPPFWIVLQSKMVHFVRRKDPKSTKLQTIPWVSCSVLMLNWLIVQHAFTCEEDFLFTHFALVFVFLLQLGRHHLDKNACLDQFFLCVNWSRDKKR